MKTRQLALIIVILFLSSCSTTRDNFFSRNYHQTTAKYNGFFNAKESMQRGLDKLHSSHKENYQKIIPINPLYNIYANDEPKNAYPNMDRVIEKTVKVIRRHSMEINDREINKWIDDNYFLMAKARFYKQDYLAAINTFNYIVRKYPNSDLVNQSLIWATKSHIKLNNQQTAESNLSFLLTEKGLSEKDKKDVYEILSEYHINKNEYGKAINYINKSLIGRESRESRARKHFILGQLYQKEEKGDSAIFSYDKVISLNPDYEMTFRSYLNKARAFAFSNNNSSELLKDYQKMLKDDKNTEYRDQIFYAISEIYLNRSDTLGAIENLNNSIYSFLYNIDQKQQSHTKLAGIYFNQKDYTNSFLQYDSIMNIINTEDVNYSQIKRKHKQLKEVSFYEETIAEQDSLLYLASLPESERNKLIDDLIDGLRQKDEQARQAANADKGGGDFNIYEYNRNENKGPNTSSGGWYFYNPSAMSFGYSEFLGRWGNRKLEDNWRRKNKSEINTEEEGKVMDEGPTEREKYDPKYYIDQLPLTAEKQKKALGLIESSYYKLGLAIKDYFLDYMGMIDRHNKMLEQFPETDYKLLVWIHHMLAYQLLEMDEERAQTLSNIFSEFPNNKYVDQNGLLLPQEDERKEVLYEQIFNLYNQQDYKGALELINQIEFQESNEISNETMLNIKMIEALCSAFLYGKGDYINYLEKIVSDYPETEVGAKARLFLDVLYGSFYETEEDVYLTEFDSDHHIIFSIEDLSIDVPKTQSIITNFNNLFYLEKELQVSNLLLNKNTQLIKVAKFNSKSQAMDYFNEIKVHEPWIDFIDKQAITILTISNNNFVTLFKEKELSAYQKYFSEKYLNY